MADYAITIFADVAKRSDIKVEKLEVIAEAEKPIDLPVLKNMKLKVNASAKAGKQLLKITPILIWI